MRLVWFVNSVTQGANVGSNALLVTQDVRSGFRTAQGFISHKINLKVHIFWDIMIILLIWEIIAMGKYNSSTYRVRPLMKCIENDYHAFLSLLSLVGIDPLSQPTSYRYDGVSCNEMQLKPTKNHLLAILESFFGFTTWQDIHRVLPQITFQDKGSIQ